ncbi:MAG: YggS family pyridoxal phosphate-dependent enzyme [Candidatus Aureabacteria bacterium]|nr:YggS family pyridoxal phosphate-dependent enzyme [Candidatus Auribacterota bacterium]NLW95070.1 YggS family pyridoxal phosphate-dependent enzyme [Chlamydiota bacterium]HOE26190.1 YggS family pyridoxal phosphate-dependent enzyme [bacterium]
MIADNVRKVRSRIEAAARRSNRPAGGIELLASTKGRSVEEIGEALAAGVRLIGENRVQEAARKFPELRGRASMQMIGHLQRNKVAEALRIFDLIHSLDRLRLAEEIEREAAKSGRLVPVLVEVNVSGEEHKFGVRPDELPEFLAAVGRFERLQVEGLMTMAPFSPDPERARPVFRRLRELAGRFADGPRLRMRHLSMGMTQDYEVAVEEGATIVRIGTAIFG